MVKVERRLFIMPVSDKQKKQRNKWDSENMKVIGVKLKKEYADRFGEYCQTTHGQTPNAYLRDYILGLLNVTDAEYRAKKIEVNNSKTANCAKATDAK